MILIFQIFRNLVNEKIGLCSISKGLFIYLVIWVAYYLKKPYSLVEDILPISQIQDLLKIIGTELFNPLPLPLNSDSNIEIETPMQEKNNQKLKIDLLLQI